jgi:ABC-type multidrug transport system ATPase subunit
MAMPAIELMRVSGLTKRYGDLAALTEINFAIVRGEILGLIGPNGSGKTTLLTCLAGMLPADAGTIIWDGVPLPPRQRKSALFYLPDGIVPYPKQAVWTVLCFFRAVYRLSAGRLEETIEALSLAPVLTKPVQTLSKGYRRRLLLACAVLTPHPLLIMDEPFDGFDLHQTREVMALLRNVAGRGRTLLLAIHQLTDAQRICDRFVLLAAGRVRGEGTLASLRGIARVPENGGLEEVFLALS